MTATVNAVICRRMGGMFLLAMLAVCAYLGNGSAKDQTVSVSVLRTSYALEDMQKDSSHYAAVRLQAQRREEIDMLNAIVESEEAAAQTKADALAQLEQMAKRMEYEAQVLGCLNGMGIETAAAICGAQAMTVMIGHEQVGGNEDMIRIVDAICSMTGFDPGDIKIILTKK